MSTDSGRKPAADFTALDGVGPKTAKALVRAGVTSMSKLAKANAYDLAQRLDDVGAPVPVNRIIEQRWLFQAWDMVTAHESEEPDEGGQDEDVVDEPIVDEPEWAEQASFIVSFDQRTGADGPQWQTRIWDNKALNEVVVDGIDPDDWAAIIADRVES